MGFFCCGGFGSGRNGHRRNKKKAALTVDTNPADSARISSCYDECDQRTFSNQGSSPFKRLSLEEVSAPATASSNSQGFARLSGHATSTQPDTSNDIEKQQAGAAGPTQLLPSVSSISDDFSVNPCSSCLSLFSYPDVSKESLPEQASTSRTRKTLVGHSLPRRDVGVRFEDARECWEEPEAASFSIRTQDYISNRIKAASEKPFYHLLHIDMFSADAKMFHIAKRLALPQVKREPVVVSIPGADVVIPPLLIINMMIPTYPATIFGSTDGPGQHIVYCYSLCQDFDRCRRDNPAAVELLAKFIANATIGPRSEPARERLKMIARVANLEQWAKEAPLNSAEAALLRKYNEKPLMMRGAVHQGASYMEIDLDVHSFTYLARAAMVGYVPRLDTVVWDVGLVLQGNTSKELPEQLLCAGRVLRADFLKQRPMEPYAVPSGQLFQTPQENQSGPDEQEDAEASP